MDRTTFSLTVETRRRLRRAAADRGVSMATIIREAIEEKVDRLTALPPKPRSLGIGASGVSDTARRSGAERPQPRSWR
ncbi:MAG: ribbon-helix-helix protein, CopG family [Chloroflexi bacterium]|nr:ribbon-helix-helix protein, CopG family [Chloroflexota bacterium]